MAGVRAMVTGAAGFIGSNLVDRLLAEGISVDGVDDLSTGSLRNLLQARRQGSAKFNFRKLDILDIEFEELVLKRKPEIIFHLAGQIDVRKSKLDPVYDANANLVGSIRVLEAARKAGVSKVIYAASGGALYGDARLVPTPESATRSPISPYGVSKAAVLDYLTLYRDLYDLEYTALAMANVYGPRQDLNGESAVISVFGSAMLKGQNVTIYGDGSQTRDFVFVDDVVDAFYKALDLGGGLIINLGTSRETEVNELFREMARQIGYSQPPQYRPSRSGEILRSALDVSRARDHLGWEPWTTLGEGLKSTIQWMGSRESTDG